MALTQPTRNHWTPFSGLVNRASLSRRRRVNRVSASHPRVIMVPHRVILAESSSPRRVLE